MCENSTGYFYSRFQYGSREMKGSACMKGKRNVSVLNTRVLKISLLVKKGTDVNKIVNKDIY